MEDSRPKWNADPMWASMVDSDKEYKPSESIIKNICTTCIIGIVDDLCDGDSKLSSYLRSITGKKLRVGDHITFSTTSDTGSSIVGGHIIYINNDDITVKLSNDINVSTKHANIRRSDNIITKLSKSDINYIYDLYVRSMHKNHRGMASIIDMYMSMCMYMRLNPKVAFKYLKNEYKYPLINDLDSKTKFLTNNADKIRKW